MTSNNLRHTSPAMSDDKRKGGRPFLGENGRVHRVNLRLTPEELALLDAVMKHDKRKDKAALIRDWAIARLKERAAEIKKTPKASAA